VGVVISTRLNGTGHTSLRRVCVSIGDSRSIYDK
jgi:hypothetical protein